MWRSTDDGRSWLPAADPMVKPWTDSSGDPDANVNHTLAYDKNGVLFLAFQASDPRFSDLPAETSSEDVYFATYRLTGPVREIVGEETQVPRRRLAATGAAMGVGLAMACGSAGPPAESGGGLN